MTRHQTLRQRLAEIMASGEAALKEAFFSAVYDLRSGVDLRAFIAAIEAGNIDKAIAAANIDKAVFHAVDMAITQAYIGGGIAAIAGAPVMRMPDGGKVVVRFDARNPRAEAKLRNLAGSLITRIANEQREVIRVNLTDALADGINPRRAALNIVGRLDRATGRRVGGVIGLSAPQERAVASARRALASGDTDGINAYLDYARRDKRFDRTVMAAWKEGKGLPFEEVDRVVGRLSDNYLALRGETIARTETVGALNASQVEAWDQIFDAGGLLREEVEKVWLSAHDNRVRESHRHMDGQAVGIDERFSNGLRFPGDAEAGDPAEIINCRCTVTMRRKKDDA